VVILKSKLEAEKHPQTPLSMRMLNLPEAFSASATVKVDGKEHSITEIRRALFYQLHERVLFVKPKDVFVSDLLYSLAVIQANIASVDDALDLLQMSREYGFVDEALLKQREQQFKARKAAVPVAKTRR
jgi:hypothetical protein